jgi:hypothetical protein
MYANVTKMGKKSNVRTASQVSQTFGEGGAIKTNISHK